MCVCAAGNPKARWLTRAGIVLVLLSSAVGLVPDTTAAGAVPLHFVRGLFLGIGLVFLVQSLILMRRSRRQG